MKRKAALLVGAVAALAALVLRRRRVPAQVAQEPEPAPDPRAEALRRRLAEGRTSEAAEQAAETGPPADEFEAMRRRVHAEGRAAREAMERSAEDVD